MESQWNTDEESAYVTRYGAVGVPPELAERIYTSHLLGRCPELVLHGGGNTSVKARCRELDGRDQDVLFIKGSGWDLATIEPSGFPACRLEPLLRLCELDTLSDADMVRGLRSQMLDPSSPTPSVEALLHALIPGKFVDHTHADAAVAILDRPDGRTLARQVWGEHAIVLPYVMPGFVLARAVRELREAGGLPEAGCLVLDKHGVFTWDTTARGSYERMLEAVNAAETHLAGVTRSALPVDNRLPHDSARLRREVATALRGAITRAHATRRVSVWLTTPEAIELSLHPDCMSLTAGPLTPDHVIRTKPWPLWLQLADGVALREQCERGLEVFAERYTAYFDRHAKGRPLKQLEPTPRVVLVPGLGACCLGETLRDSNIIADLYAHTAATVLQIAANSRFDPVSESDLFDLEYWSLEQAKLGKASPCALAGRIGIVTGAAGGIGLATAEAMLNSGCHVLLSDISAALLAKACQRLQARFGTQVRCHPCDVTSAEAASALVATCIDEFGGLDYLISNAGTAPTGLLHESAGQEGLEASLRVNLMGHQNVASAATRWLIAQGCGGCLLFNASKAAFAPGPEFGPYAVAKSALVALARQYAIDLGAHGIRANAVNADRVRTGLFDEGVLERRASARGISPSEYFRQNLLRRETLASDVADAFLWLCRAEATTGSVVTIDGGNPAAFPR